MTFLTGISLITSAGAVHSHVEEFDVHFTELSLAQITAYVNSEMPLDCAGSFKCEGQGILLFESLSGRDINALVGMPLIALKELCLKEDVDLFQLLNR